MRLRRLALAVFCAVGAIGALTPAFAQDDWRWHERHEWRERDWRRHEWREHEWREHYYTPPAFGVRPYGYPPAFGVRPYGYPREFGGRP